MSIFKIPGEKIVLKDIVENDINDYYKWFTEELEWTKWDAPWEKMDMEFKKKYISKLSTEIINGMSKTRKRMEIYYNDKHLGWVSSYHKKNNQLAAGIIIAEEQYWGRGLGREIFGIWVDYLFENHKIDELFCDTWSGNVRMINLALRTGFTIIDNREIIIVNENEYQRVKLRKEV